LVKSSLRSSTYSPLLGQDAPRPLINSQNRRLLVRKLRRAAGTGLLSGPRCLAEGLGITAVWIMSGELCPEPMLGVCFYVWHHDPRERGLRILCSLVRVLLRRERVAFNASDVWLLALDLAVPEELAFVVPDEMVDALEECPAEIIREVLAARESP
jgi:hypothetical protein